MKAGCIAALLLFCGAGAIPASMEPWGPILAPTLDVPLTSIPTTELPQVLYQGVMVPALPLPPGTLLPSLQLPNGLVPLTVIREEPIQVQALSVNLLLDKWIKLDSLLDTPAIYAGNHFAVEAAAIRAQATKEGISDAILRKCAAFAAALKRAEAGQ